MKKLFIFFFSFILYSNGYAAEIFLVEPQNGTIIQRKQGVGVLEITGSSNVSLKPFEYRIVYNGTNDAIPGHNWKTLNITTTSNGFKGSISAIPQGGWYNIDLRYKDLSAFYEGKNSWGVGILIAVIGQSNGARWFYAGSGQMPNNLLRKYNENGWAELSQSANGGVTFGNAIINSLGIPVGLLGYAVTSSSLSIETNSATTWMRYNEHPYYSFISGLKKIGSSLEFVIWIQGESDAARNISEAIYEKNLKSFITKIREDVSNCSSKPELPFLISLLGTTTSSSQRDLSWQAIRNAQMNVSKSIGDCYIASTTVDFEMADAWHYSAEEYIKHGARFANTVLYILGRTGFYRGPIIYLEQKVSNSIIEVYIRHSGGDDFIPQNGIAGFEVLDNGNPVGIKSITKKDKSTVQILLSSALTGIEEVRYLYGKNPPKSNFIIDNSNLRLPLEGNPTIPKRPRAPKLSIKK